MGGEGYPGIPVHVTPAAQAIKHSVCRNGAFSRAPLPLNGEKFRMTFQKRIARLFVRTGGFAMLKPMSTLMGGLALVACAGMDANIALSTGTLRVEPHPIHEDSVRVITLHRAPLYVDSLGRGRGTAEAHRATIDALFGDKCRNAPIIQEGTVQVTSMRQDAALRVICPEARK
jgi:hypothetical protein